MPLLESLEASRAACVGRIRQLTFSGFGVKHGALSVENSRGHCIQARLFNGVWGCGLSNGSHAVTTGDPAVTRIREEQAASHHTAPFFLSEVLRTSWDVSTPVCRVAPMMYGLPWVWDTGNNNENNREVTHVPSHRDPASHQPALCAL